MKRVSPAIIAPLGLAALLILIAANGSTPAHSASFNPVATICLDDQTTVDPNPLVPGDAGECDGSNAPGGNVALTRSFGVGLGPDGKSQQGTGDDTPDYNFGATMTFSPPEWGIARGTDMPIGAIVGTLNSNLTLGLLGNPCWSPVLAPLTFVNASINPADTIVPKPPGAKDRLEPLNHDANGNYIADGADRWPSYLNDIFSGVPASDIRARLFGVNATAVAETTIVLNIVVLEPGSPVPGGITPDPRLGYPAVTVLQDPTAPASSDDVVSDFCAPLSVATTVFGVTEDNPNTSANEGGNAYRQNPGDGAYSFLTFFASLADADGDGVENPLDPCPLTPDPNWNPRGNAYQPGSDDDADGLPNSCDPNPTVPSPIVISGFDEDRDQWRNRMDNCPLVANGPSQEGVPGVGNNDDEDDDGIGDACDPHPNDADAEGVPVNVCVVNTLEIGAGGTPPIAPGTYQDCDPNALLPAEEPPNDACSLEGGLLLCISADKQAYVEGQPVTLSLSVTATASVTLSYGSTQEFDFVVTTWAGEEVWRWSDDMVFADVFWERVLEPGETLDYVQVWHQGDNAGLQVPPGSYLVWGEATFCTPQICHPLTSPVAISVASDVTEVEIDIKPGGDPNSTNLGSQGVIPVAVLTTDTFDASSVDPTTVDFAGASPLRSALEDVDDDGDTDLIMHFRTQDTNIADEATEACLTGETSGGDQFEACDSVRIVPPEADADGDSLGVGLPRVFGDDVEATLGTDQFAACGENAWPPDMNDDGSVNILDVFEMFPAWLGVSIRHDLNTDGSVNIVDVFRMFPFWTASCT